MIFLAKTNMNPENFLTKTIEAVNSDIEQGKKTIQLSNELFMGYMKVITVY